MTTPDVNVVVIDFPNYEREMVVPNEDGSYTVMLNARLSVEHQQIAYKHAMEHIKNMDFEKKDVQKIEAIAHQTKPQPQNVVTKPAEIKPYRTRRSTAKQWKEVNDRIDFIMEHIANGDPDYFFHKAVDNWLYGGL